jgi:hypothetical protein
MVWSITARAGEWRSGDVEPKNTGPKTEADPAGIGSDLYGDELHDCKFSMKGNQIQKGDIFFEDNCSKL